ncbi:NADH:flavin oxidoreductase [Streptomyces sp. NPDC057253]|uniref:NADH:flavin oxidoreductase n=1 Tax=Streptomyces sp. NPDC057253 TaxID=3346069 RepID=UPI0036389411
MAAASNPLSRLTELLSRPITINGLTLANRIAMSPMTRMHSPGGVPGENVAAYYARRAAAGVGLLVTEGTFLGHESAGGVDTIPLFHGEEQLAGWKAVADAVHAVGGRIMPQLMHVGVQRPAGGTLNAGAPTISPSAIGLDGTEGVGRAMTLRDVDDVMASYAEAAASAERIGFDGVEIHGAHGYLIDEFLWARTNRRTDAYGGDLKARTKFAAEVVAAIRDAVSPEFPVQFRFSQWKNGVYDARLAETPQELEELLTPLVAAGVDAFHGSQRRYWVPEFEGSDLNLAGWAKKVTGKPTITVGSVGLGGGTDFVDTLFHGKGAEFRGLDDLLDRLEADEFDLVAVGRSLLQDPEWAVKVLAGRFDEIKPFDPAALATLS